MGSFVAPVYKETNTIRFVLIEYGFSEISSSEAARHSIKEHCIKLFPTF
jgi:hypothetical protein